MGQRIAAARAAVLAGQREKVTRARFDLHDACLRRYIGAIFHGLSVERLHAFYLDKGHCYIADERVGEGDCGRAAANLRAMVTRAIDLGASGLVLVHNHPSGDPEPSEGDIKETRRLSRSLAELDLVLADHVIVGETSMRSMRGAGLL